jgi:hypothetical protein
MQNISNYFREELVRCIEEGSWTLDANLHAALQDRAIELDGDQVDIGGADFWFEEQDYLTPEQLHQLLDDNFMVQFLMFHGKLNVVMFHFI